MAKLDSVRRIDLRLQLGSVQGTAVVPVGLLERLRWWRVSAWASAAGKMPSLSSIKTGGKDDMNVKPGEVTGLGNVWDFF